MTNRDDQLVPHRIVRIGGDGAAKQQDELLIRESLLRVVVNGMELVIANILPEMQREFVYGLLLANGLIKRAGDIQSLELDLERGNAFVELTGVSPLQDFAHTPTMLGTACGTMPKVVSTHRLAPLKSGFKVGYEQVTSAAKQLQKDSQLFQQTGGVHSVELCDGAGRVVLRADDIGRHNAVDKVIGGCMLGQADPTASFMMTTGRLSSEIVTKAWRAGIPVLASRSCATSLAVEIANDASITLVGFVRGNRCNVYTATERIAWEQ